MKPLLALIATLALSTHIAHASDAQTMEETLSKITQEASSQINNTDQTAEKNETQEAVEEVESALLP